MPVPEIAWPTTICEVLPEFRVTVALLKMVETLPVSVCAGAKVAQLSLAPAVAPATAQPPMMPLVRAKAEPPMLVRLICALPGRLEPRAVPAKMRFVPAVRVTLPMFSEAILFVAAAGGVTVIVLAPCRRLTPLPVLPMVSDVEEVFAPV